ncbi:MAG: HEAT repeat domain-containing protein [bacterium]|nr:HEAT repeat domain-containing protein [bacterium]
MTHASRFHVFVSYSTKDYPFVERLRANLNAAHISYWLDTESLMPGTPNWEKAIKKAIQDVAAVILVATPNVPDSSYVTWEIAVALMFNKPIYAVWADGDHWVQCVPAEIYRTQHIDMRGAAFDSGFGKLTGALSGTLADFVYTPPPVKPLAAGVKQRSPYKGLNAFKEDDAGDFYGRAAAIHALVERFTERATAPDSRLLAVMGASGSGKSSVVMAGLIPRLKKTPPSAEWLYIPPITPGSTPIRALARGLFRALPHIPFSTLEDELRHPNGLGLANLGYALDQRVVLFIDQFEELFMPGVEPEERDHIINLIVQAANEPDGAVAVLLTLRADYYDRPLNYHDLGGLIMRHQYGLLPMTLMELREAVELPAHQPDAGLAFAPGLVGEIVFDLRESKDKMALAGALPLLQFTLEQLYLQRDTSAPVHRLTLEAYVAMGGVSGAISRHAEAIFTALDREAQSRLERVFVRLINVDDRGDPTRVRAPFADFAADEAALRLINALVNGRLLLVDRADEQVTVEVAHEALLRNWERLVRWIATAAEQKRLLQKLETDAAYWARRGRPRDQFRYVHEQWAEIETIRQQWGITFSPLIEAFLQPEIDRLVEDLALGGLKGRVAEDRLRTLKADAAPALIGALRNHNVSRRNFAAKLLGEAGDPGAVEPLIEALGDSAQSVRGNAARSLGVLGDPRAIDALIALLSDKDTTVRANAASSLGKIGDARAFEPLVALLNDPAESARSSATAALGKLNDARALEPLRGMLHDESPEVRRNAVTAFGTLNDLRAFDWVAAVLSRSRDHIMVRRSAVYVLGRWGDVRALELLTEALHDSDEQMRRNAAEALAKLDDPRAIDALFDALNDADLTVRHRAVSGLGRLAALHPAEQARVIDVLAGVKESETQWYVRNAAQEALTALTHPVPPDA